MLSRKQTFLNSMAATAMRKEPRPRKIWDAIVFGFEIEMLELHMRTLFDTVPQHCLRAVLCLPSPSSRTTLRSRAY